MSDTGTTPGPEEVGRQPESEGSLGVAITDFAPLHAARGETPRFTHEGRVISLSNIDLHLRVRETDKFKHILRDVSLVIPDIVIDGKGGPHGQVVVLLGPSGIGKTQLAKIISGLRSVGETPLSRFNGLIELGEERSPVAAGDVGMVFQQYTLFDHLSAFNNLVVPARRSGLSRADAKVAAAELLKQFGLSKVDNNYPAQLSGGQRQRLAVAQQFARGHHLLIMDEPLSGLDEGNKIRMRQLIRRAADIREENTIIVVTHDRSILEVADHVWIMGHEMRDGEVLPGARIVDEFDLLDMQLTRDTRPPNESVEQQDARFHELDRDIVRRLIELTARAEEVR